MLKTPTGVILWVLAVFTLSTLVDIAQGAAAAPRTGSQHNKAGLIQASICDPFDGSDYGLLTSPNYPNCYPNNVDCTWVIHSDWYPTVVAYFYDFQTEECCDYLEIRDGPYEWSPLIGRFSGSYASSVVARSGYMRVTFHTDGSVVRRGFEMSYYGYYDDDYSSTELPSAANPSGQEDESDWDQIQVEARKPKNLTKVEAVTSDYCNSYSDDTTNGPSTTRKTTTPTPGSPGIVINNNNNMFVNFFGLGNWTSSLDSWYAALKGKLGGGGGGAAGAAAAAGGPVYNLPT